MTTLERCCDFLVRQRGALLFSAIVLTAMAYPLSLRLQFDQSIESLYAYDDPHLVDFRASKRAFGGDEFLILAWRDPALFDDRGELTDEARQRIERLSREFAAIPGIQADSIQNIANALRTPYARKRIREFLEGILVGKDGATTAIIARLQPQADVTTPRADTFRQVRQLAQTQTIPTVVVGEPIQVHEMFRYVEEDGNTLGLWSTVMLTLVIYVLFRSFRWMLLPFAVVQVTVVWTRAILVLSGIPLSMVSSMLTSLVTIIGVTTVMHLTLRYRDLRREQSPEDALLHGMQSLAFPVFWTVVTTAAGFIVLVTSHISPVASFGIIMTVATMLVLVVSATVLPGGVLIGRVESLPGVAPGEPLLMRTMAYLADVIHRHPFPIGIVMLVSSTVCSIGLLHLEVETDFSKNFRANSPVVTALDFFETHLGGAGTWEVNFEAPETLTEEYLEKVRELGQDLRTLEQRPAPGQLTKAVVLTDGLDLIPSQILFTRVALSTRLNLLDAMQPAYVGSLYNPEQGRMRIMLRALERQPAASKLALIHDAEALARKHFPDAKATGLFVLLSYLIDSLLGDQVTSTLWASVLLVGMMVVAFRSLSLSIALLIPNFFPLVLVIGTMGWMDMKINIATAMISCVSLGLTIDNSIVYLAEYNLMRARGMPFAEAIRETHRDVGSALVWINLALVVGFSVLTLSHFIPLVYFGILVSVAIIGGLVGNIVLLPLLLRFIDPKPALEERVHP